MNQLTFLEPSLWTVNELTIYLRDLLESDNNLQDIWVKGEASNISHPTSGHLYFTLKDNHSALRCVMWRNAVSRLTVMPCDGDALEVHGSINIYEAAGQYQLYADLIRPTGEGALFQKFTRLKAQLEAEGLFAPERKRTIPRFPQVIGIVTSPTGAALHDILNTIRRRYTLARIVLAPTPVQGDEAPAGIMNALEAQNQIVNPDVIILARGGGSMEDLWAFNEEAVVRAIAASAAAVICGVGHETDITIADFVCDLRAPTPTAAAELATPNRADLKENISDLSQMMARVITVEVNSQRLELNYLDNKMANRSPQTRVRSDRQRLDELFHRSGSALRHKLVLQRTNLTSLEHNLASLNPSAIMKRGYAVVSFPDSRIVRSVTQVQSDDELDVCVQDGRFGVQVRG
ncbi:exodeoxyribonuclease VII large subunit [Chloroflexota bacterium]